MSVLIGATCAILAGTLLAGLLLLGRFVLLAVGFFVAGTALVTLQDRLFSGWQGVAVLSVALVLIVLGRPEAARRKRVRV